MSVTVTVDQAGIDALHAHVHGTTTLRLSEDMASDMTRYAPVDTGELRATIRLEPGAVVHRIWAGDVAGGVDYHLYQEFGTSVMAAQPYIRPAVYQYRGA